MIGIATPPATVIRLPHWSGKDPAVTGKDMARSPFTEVIPVHRLA